LKLSTFIHDKGLKIPVRVKQAEDEDADEVEDEDEGTASKKASSAYRLFG